MAAKIFLKLYNHAKCYYLVLYTAVYKAVHFHNVYSLVKVLSYPGLDLLHSFLNRLSIFFGIQLLLNMIIILLFKKKKTKFI